MNTNSRIDLDYVLKVSSEFDNKKTSRKNHLKAIEKQAAKVNRCLSYGVAKVSNIYLMKAGKNNYKIGVSINPSKRVRGVQTGNPDTVELLHSVETYRALPIEKLLHLIFSNHKLEGEWFRFYRFDIPYIIGIMNVLAATPKVTAKHLI